MRPSSRWERNEKEPSKHRAAQLTMKMNVNRNNETEKEMVHRAAQLTMEKRERMKHRAAQLTMQKKE